MKPSFLQAYRLYESGHYRRAIKAAKALLPEAENKGPLIYLVGLAAYEAGEQERGRKLMAEGLKRAPFLEGYYNLTSFFKSGNERAHARGRLSSFVEGRLTHAFILSYPKCGRTWLRFMLGRYLLGFESDANPLPVQEFSFAAPDFTNVQITHDDFPQWKHFSKVSTAKGIYSGKKVLLLVRDPRDVLVSNYFQVTLRGDAEWAESAFDGSLSNFVRHHTGGLASIVAYYNVWARKRHVPRAFQLLTYEEMVANPFAALKQTVAFLDWPKRPDAHFYRVIDNARFDKMRALEASNRLDSKHLRPPPDGNPEGFKVRRGKVGGYRDYLSEADLAYINAFLAERLDPFYPYRQEMALSSEDI